MTEIEKLKFELRRLNIRMKTIRGALHVSGGDEFIRALMMSNLDADIARTDALLDNPSVVHIDSEAF